MPSSISAGSAGSTVELGDIEGSESTSAEHPASATTMTSDAATIAGAVRLRVMVSS
jgi:hypothetical protein